MKSDLHYITAHLAPYHAKLLSSATMHISIRHAEEFDCNNGPFYSDILYVARASQLSAEIHDANISALVCIEDAPIPRWLLSAKDFVTIVVDQTVSFSVIAEAVSYVYGQQRRLAAFLDNYFAISNHSNGLQTLLDHACAFLQKPITLLDPSLRILASSFPDDFQFGILSEKNRLNKYLDEATTNSLFQSKRFSSAALSPTPRITDVSITASQKIYEDYAQIAPGYSSFMDYAIRLNRVIVAYICIASREPFDIFSSDFLVCISNLALIELQKSEWFIHNSGIHFESLLLDLLESRLASEEAISIRLRSLKRTSFPFLSVIVINCHNNADAIPNMLQDSIRSMFPGSLSMVYMNDVVLLWGSKSPINPASLPSTFIALLQSHGFIAGISNSFSKYTEVHQHYVEAVSAISTGSKLDSVAFVFPYGKYSSYDALRAYSEKHYLSSLCFPEMLELYHRSNSSDIELLDTVYTYTFYVRNVSKASSALHIHRNTLFYRLQKFKQLLDIDFDDGAAFLKVMISFQVLKMMGTGDSSKWQPPILELDNLPQ